MASLAVTPGTASGIKIKKKGKGNPRFLQLEGNQETPH